MRINSKKKKREIGASYFEKMKQSYLYHGLPEVVFLR